MQKGTIDVECPCCRAVLRVDVNTGTVLTHKQPEKPPAIEDIGAAVQALKGEAARREELFQKSFVDQKARQSTMDQRFDELLKQAKNSPDTGPQKRDIDLD